MFYFFERSEQFIRCEIHREGDSYELVIVRPGGREEHEQFPTEEALRLRWEALQQELEREGWGGPHGRE